MISATAATWLNYATTLAFQVLFAAHFGSSPEAGGFVIAFAIAVSAAGILITTVTTLVMPQLVGGDGLLSSRAFHNLGRASVGVVVLAGLVVIAGFVAPTQIAPVLGLSHELITPVVVLSGVIIGVFGLAGMSGVLALARGRRFIPAAGPALPSTTAAAYLATAESAGVVGLLTALAVGGMLQLALVTTVALTPRLRATNGPPHDFSTHAVQMALVLVAISLIAPIQRLTAGSLDAAGVPRFDYAMRSVQTGIQLLIGGLLVAVLPDWSRLAHSSSQFRGRVTETVALVGFSLASAAAIALVAAPNLVGLIFERGAFTYEDTASIAQLVRLMSLGFIAEGVTLLLAQAFFAAKRAELAIRAGWIRAFLQVVLTLALGLAGGAQGVAIAYTITMVVTAGVMLKYGWGTVIESGQRRLILRATLAALSIGSVGVAVMLAHDTFGPLGGVATVVAVTAALALWLGLHEHLATLRSHPARF